MFRFQWDLHKSLEYINSKRQNLEIRAVYLKLLIDYDKECQNDREIKNSKENSPQKQSKLNKYLQKDNINEDNFDLR